MIKLRPFAAFLAAFVFVLNSALGAPAISTQPVSQNVLVGAAVTLSVTATGTGSLSYRWQKNGINLPDATGTSATYSIASTTVSESGSYTVIVTDTAGSTTSNAAILTVYPDPSIVTQPIQSQTVIAGAMVRFSVVAIGSGTLTYQWKKGGENIPNATSASYVILNAAPADAGNYTVFVENTVTSGTKTDVTSNAATLVVHPLPEITTQPAGVFADVGSSATFSVAATSANPLAYQWQKEGVNISGATSNSFTISSVAATDAGSYRVIVSDSVGSTTSSTVALVVGVSAPAPDGYAASVTGGGSLAAKTVTTPAEFRSLAEDPTAQVITVSGTLDLGATKVAVKSNKTIHGLNDVATLIGNLELASGVSNVIIRGLHISNPSGAGNGDGISIVGATNVYITHCTFFDCTDGLLDITAGADNVTISWCEFYYTNATAAHRHAMMIGAETGETKALRVTLHHNWWGRNVAQNMPVTTWGHVHMYNNLIDSAGNAATTKVQASAQLLSEHNRYAGVKDPLVKSGTGLIRANNNLYTNTTLTDNTTAEPGTDTVFTPPYSYEVLPPSDWTAALKIGAGNAAGAASKAPVAARATAKSTATTVTAGGSFTLSPELAGIAEDDVIGYQWRFNNVPLVGGDVKEFHLASVSTGFSGAFTVVVLKPSGAGVVSSPVNVTVNAAEAPATDTPTDGGGAPSVWFLTALSLAAAGRYLSRRSGKANGVR